ncbi:MAG: hypothetical protein BroJett039_04500 [Chloroflexota bacterium]|nr:MAG: hypothetical protein BroJett039_04500 [Chloroflexota bacterium]
MKTTRQILHLALIARGATLVIQARSDINLIDCEALEYLGASGISFGELRARRNQFLIAAQRKYPARGFTRVRFDIEAADWSASISNCEHRNISGDNYAAVCDDCGAVLE